MEVKHIFKEVTHGIFHWESSIFKTIKELIIQPGIFLKKYIAGIRKPYVKPFSYFIFIQTIYVLLFHWVSDRFFSYINPIMNPNVTQSQMLKVEEIQHLITSNINYLNFFLPIFLAFYLMIFMKKRTGINYAESIVISLYLQGTLMIFGIVTMPFVFLNPSIWQYRFVFNIVYTIFIVIQFGGYSKLSGIIKGFFASVLSMLTYIVLVAIITIIYIVFIKHYV